MVKFDMINDKMDIFLTESQVTEFVNLIDVSKIEKIINDNYIEYYEYLLNSPDNNDLIEMED